MAVKEDNRVITPSACLCAVPEVRMWDVERHSICLWEASVKWPSVEWMAGGGVKVVLDVDVGRVKGNAELVWGRIRCRSPDATATLYGNIFWCFGLKCCFSYSIVVCPDLHLFSSSFNFFNPFSFKGVRSFIQALFWNLCNALLWHHDPLAHNGQSISFWKGETENEIE